MSKTIIIKPESLFRRFVRWHWFGCFLGEYEWYRKLYGGKWMQTYVDGPVNGCMWLNVPDWATPSYREPQWRGTPSFIDYDTPNDSDYILDKDKTIN